VAAQATQDAIGRTFPAGSSTPSAWPARSSGCWSTRQPCQRA